MKPHSKTKHGLAKTKVYIAWRDMHSRCRDPKHPYFVRYGKRGVKVCLRWHCFENFLADVGEPPSPELTLERRDNDAGYEPENVYWATKKQQARNRHSSVVITYRGVTRTLPEWAETLGVSYHALRERMYRGWNPKRMFTQPFR